DGDISQPIIFVGGGGNDTIDINSGSCVLNADAGGDGSNVTVNVAAGAAVSLDATQHLAALNIDAGSAALTAGGDKVLVMHSLTITNAGQLDLSDNGMILDYPPSHPSTLSLLSFQMATLAELGTAA